MMLNLKHFFRFLWIILSLSFLGSQYISAAEKMCSTQPIFQNGFQEFCIREKRNITGGMKIIGNTILVAPEEQNSAICSSYTNGPFIDNDNDTRSYPLTNSAYYLCGYQDNNITGSNVDNSTTAELNLPENAVVEWAGLYWQALGESDDQNNSAFIGKDILVKHQNDTAAFTVHPLQVFYTTNTDNVTRYPYSAFADITDYVKTHGEGNYTVADIPVHEGKHGGLGTYGAWTMVVIYKKYNDKFRNITIFDGYQQVTGSHDVEVTAEGFLTPKANSIDSKVFIFTAEGDRYISGDWLEIENKNNSGNMEKIHNTDDLPSSNNCYGYSDCKEQSFYSYIKTENERFPEIINNMGIDIQQFELCGNTSEDTCKHKYMQHDQTDIRMRFTSEGDYYWPSLIAFEELSLPGEYPRQQKSLTHSHCS